MDDEYRPRHLVEKCAGERPRRRLRGIAAAQDHEVDLVAFSPKTDLVSGSSLDDISGDRNIGRAFLYEVLHLFVRFPSPDVPLERVGRHISHGPAFHDANDRQSSPKRTGDGERVRYDALAHRRSADACGDMAECDVRRRCIYRG